MHTIQAPWKWYFELKTRDRTYMLYAATEEERELWINGFHRIIKLPVKDPHFQVMGALTKEQIQEDFEGSETAE